MPSKSKSQDLLIHRPERGFFAPYTAITHDGDPGGFKLDFGIRRLAAGEKVEEEHSKESFWLLLQGKAELVAGSKKAVARRDSLFDDPPTALTVGTETAVEILSITASEWAVVRTANHVDLEPRILLPADIPCEKRGAGLAQDACLRTVRTIADLQEREDSLLTLGETVGQAGRWSCFPPVHHDQPGLQHFRFTLPQGYGLAECGDQAFRVRDGDTLKIPGGSDYAHVSAPGYGMYCLWIVRSLPGNPFTEARTGKHHAWMLDPSRQGWSPAAAKTAPPKPKRR